MSGKKRRKLIRMTAHSQTLKLLKGQIAYLGREMDVVLVAKDTGNLRQLAEGEGVEWRDVDMHREISLLADLRSLLALIGLFRREKPDIVHANTPKGALLGLLAALMARVPHRIYNVNGLRFETATGNLRRLLIAMERVACACATKVIPQSNGVADIVRREHITRKPLEVIRFGSGNGVDTGRFDPADSQVAEAAATIRSDNPGVTYVYVGRLVGDKGVNELVEAFARLRSECDDVRLLLVGPHENNLDPLKPDTEEKIKSVDGIVALGRRDDVRPFLAASDVFVLPSYREGFPNVVLEASAMGLPCIVSDVNGATDAITDGVNGLIIPKRDTDALYSAMQRLHDDATLRGAMASVARSIVIEKFRHEDVCQATLDMYKSLTK